MRATEEKESGNGIVFLIAGVALGAALGLLFAPKVGDEMRSDVADWSRNNSERVRSLWATIKDRLPTKIKTAGAYGAIKEGGSEALREAKRKIDGSFHKV